MCLFHVYAYHDDDDDDDDDDADDDDVLTLAHIPDTSTAIYCCLRTTTAFAVDKVYVLHALHEANY